jgi:hypothetical protein
MNPLWSGKTKDTFNQYYSAMLNSGDYETFRSKVSAILEILDSSLIEINKYKNWCDTLQNSLTGGSPMSLGCASGNLMLDPVEISNIDSDTRAIESDGRQAYSILCDAMSQCGSLVNFGSCGSDLDNAYSKLMRIGRLREAIDEYASNVEKLDVGLSGDYANWKKTQLSPITMIASPNQVLSAAWNQTLSIKQLEEAKSSLETILAKDFSEWTEDDAKAIALVYKNAMEEGDEETLNKIIENCMVAEICKSEVENSIIYNYNVTADSEKISAILSELDPVHDVEKYNLLYRIGNTNITGCKITETDMEVNLNLDISCDEKGIETITFSIADDSESISRLDFSNAKITSEKALSLFDDSYIKSLNGTFAIAESQDDIDALSALYNLDYDKISLIDPANISTSEQVNFTVFANNLIMYGTEENPMCEVENLINGLIITDETRCFQAGGNYGNAYMGMLATCTMAEILCESTMLYKTISAEDEYEQYDDVREYMFGQCLLYSLYNTIQYGKSADYFWELDSEYQSGNQTFKIANLQYDKINKAFTMDLGLYKKGDDGEYSELVETSYRQYEGITLTDNEINRYENDDYVFRQHIGLRVSLETSVLSMISTDTLSDYAEAHDEMELKRTEAILGMVMSVLGEAKLIPESAGSITDIMSGVIKSDGSVDYLSSLCGLIGGDDGDSNSDSGASAILEKSNKYLSALTKCAYEYYTSKLDYEEKVKDISDKYTKYTMGIGITGEVDLDTVLSKSGIYDPYRILSIKKYEQGGLNGCAEYVEGIDWTDDFDSTYDNAESNNVNGIRYKIGYVKDSDNYADFQTRCYRLSRQYDLDYNELIENLSECIDYLLYGNDPDGDGNVDYDKDLWDYDPFILNLAVATIENKQNINCLEYISEEYNS